MSKLLSPFNRRIIPIVLMIAGSVIFNLGVTWAIGTASTTYYSKGSLDAGSLASWNSARNGSGSAPTNFTGADSFVIQNGHNMTTATALTLSNTGSLLWIENSGALTVNTANLSIMGAQIDAGGTLTINSGRTLTVNNGNRAPDLTVNGTVVNAGTVTIASYSTVGVYGTVTNSGTISSSSSKLAFNSGSKYQHNWTTDNGTIPAATWDNNSTVEIIGYTTNSGAPAGLGGQAFGNFTWNAAGQTQNIALGGNLETVNGNLTIAATGSGSVRLADSPSSGTVNVGGNVSVNNGTFYVLGTGGTLSLNIGGNITVNGGTFNLAGGTGTPTVNLTGNVVLNGGTLASSIGSRAATLNVAGDWTNNGGVFNPNLGTVNFTKNGVATVSSSAMQGTLPFCNLTISANTTVDTTDDYIGVSTATGCGAYTQTGKLRHEAPAQNVSGTSTFTFKDGRNRDSVVLTKQSGNDLGNTSLTVTSNLQPVTCGSTSIGTQATLRTFDIVPTQTGGTYTLRLYFSASSPNEANGNTTSSPYNLAIFHCGSTGWQKISGSGGSDANGVYVQATMSSFSPFAIGPDTPTAVNVARFETQSDASGISVEWQTMSEMNTSGFQIERALDGKTFTQVGAFVSAKGSGSGASYSVQDTTVPSGQTAYYRLIEIAFDGTQTIYGPISSTRSSVLNPIYLPLVAK